MISPRLFVTLPPEERKLWHTHEFEVKSGMLIMPTPSGVPNAAWEVAETAEMRDIIPNYGKTYHFWQVDRGDPIPLGAPQLMGSFTSEESVKLAKKGGTEELVKDRDERFGVDFRAKCKKRLDIPDVKKHPGLYSVLLLAFRWEGWLVADLLSRCRYVELASVAVVECRMGRWKTDKELLLISSFIHSFSTEYGVLCTNTINHQAT